MKIRTSNQFQDRIDSERIWRIKEISTLRAQCFGRGEAVAASKAIRRSFVPIAYAHWEGFVKKSAHYYAEYVAMQGLPLMQLSSPFVSMYLMQKFSAKILKKESHSLIDICETIKSAGEGAVRINYENAISTESNLNFEVLQNICTSLGLDYSGFETKRLFIDVGLVKRRNTIAHGEKQDVEESDLEDVKNQVVGLIDQFKTELENAVVLGKYRIAIT